MKQQMSSRQVYGNETAAYLGLDISLHLEIVDMKTTLGLLRLPSPPACTLTRITLSTLDRTVPVTNAAISLIQEFVPWDIVLLDVPLDEGEVPCEQRVELEETGAVYFERLEVCAVSSLGCTTACDHCFDTEIFVCSASRFDLCMSQC